jgi:poly-beta-1,6-N-acetyl-D-glucosamine biosynthesis protein PgaD
MKELGKAFSSPFKDPAWVSKFIIAGLFILLSLFVIGIPIIVGYLIHVTQRVMRREEHPLPPWTDIGIMFVTGFKYCVVYLIYLLPVFILIIPMIGIAAASELADSPDVVGVFATVYLFAFTLLIIPYSLILTAIMPIVAYRFAEREKIGDALDIGRILRDFKLNWQNTLIVALIAVGIQSFAFIGIIFLIIGVIFSIFYSYLVTAYMHGILYLELPAEERRSAA